MTDELKQYREQIDAADEKLMDALAERIAVVKKVGIYKKVHNLPPLDPERWHKVLEAKLVQAKDRDLSEDLVRAIYERIHKEALEIEKKA